MSDGPENAATPGETAACGARKRDGTRCALPPAAGRRRCFQHGGARGIGAPKDNRNAWKHGVDGREWLAERRRLNDFMRQCRETLRLEGVALGERPERRHRRRRPGPGLTASRELLHPGRKPPTLACRGLSQMCQRQTPASQHTICQKQASRRAVRSPVSSRRAVGLAQASAKRRPTPSGCD
jgi:hypothetical protein